MSAAGFTCRTCGVAFINGMDALVHGARAHGPSQKEKDEELVGKLFDFLREMAEQSGLDECWMEGLEILRGAMHLESGTPK